MLGVGGFSPLFFKSSQMISALGLRRDFEFGLSINMMETQIDGLNEHILFTSQGPEVEGCS